MCTSWVISNKSPPVLRFLLKAYSYSSVSFLADINSANLKDQSGTMKESETTSKRSFLSMFGSLASSDEETGGDSSEGNKAKSELKS